MGQQRFLDTNDQQLTANDPLPVALGVIRNVEAETYDEAVNRQIAEVREKSKAKTFDELTATLDTFLL